MRFLVIGCGSIGSRHARNLSRIDGVELIVTDVDEESRSSVGRQTCAIVAETLEQGLSRRPAAVLVCVPTHLHVEVARAAIQAGAHLFIEKPISHTLAGVDDLIQEAARKGKVLFVGCNMRFHRPISMLKRWIDEDTIGRPLFGRLRFGNALPNWRPQRDYRETYSARAGRGGGIVFDAVHEIDCAMQFFGEVSRVTARTNTLGALDIDAEDVAEIVLDFRSGAMAQIHLDYLRPVRARSYEMVGNLGMVTWEARGKAPEHCDMKRCDSGGTLLESHSFDQDLNTQYVAEMLCFVDCVAGKQIPPMDGVLAKRVLEVALGIHEASKFGLTIKV